MINNHKSPHRFPERDGFEEAATNGFCKLCAARFPTMEGLWTRLRDEHSEPSTRKTMAMEAFPIFFRLDRLQDVLPAQNEEMSTPTCQWKRPHMGSRVQKDRGILVAFPGRPHTPGTFPNLPPPKQAWQVCPKEQMTTPLRV
ncbi:hypothetical protein TNIN_125501 [Trichonephila inaurata madagascariensis]|uniref:Uncharacterized protein n=1 Tax=Trichonephila inaurata madagascariensis TaxID=2747483 RepID=A0A8X6XTA6_9ARAC|nr:hypothetical protein TNIN_125501 [Trichonephila inaurata madagascariensis]